MVKKATKLRDKKSTSNTRTQRGKRSVSEDSAKVVDPAEINDKEREVLETQVQKDEEDKSHVSTKNLELAVTLVENMFNLKGKDFNVTSFKDSSSKFVINLSNGDFDVSIVVADKDKYGLM